MLIETEYGDMETFVKHPDEGGPFPVVIFLMDAPGMRLELHDMARRLATSGYYVALPNLYYRTDPNFILDFADKTETSRIKMYEQMNIYDLVKKIKGKWRKSKESPVAPREKGGGRRENGGGRKTEAVLP